MTLSLAKIKTQQIKLSNHPNCLIYILCIMNCSDFKMYLNLFVLILYFVGSIILLLLLYS